MAGAENNMSADETSVMCICRTCPSWVECKEKVGYCHPKIGRSKCIKNENGCICGGCPVHSRMKYTSHYFCTRGTEQEQTKKK